MVEPKYRGLLLFRSIVGTVGVNIQFYAMSKMVLTDAVVRDNILTVNSCLLTLACNFAIGDHTHQPNLHLLSRTFVTMVQTKC